MMGAQKYFLPPDAGHPSYATGQWSFGSNYDLNKKKILVVIIMLEKITLINICNYSSCFCERSNIIRWFF